MAAATEGERLRTPVDPERFGQAVSRAAGWHATRASGSAVPKCRSATWEEGVPGSVGAVFRGRNRVRLAARWSRCEVVAAEPGRAFAFRTLPERLDPSRRDSTTWSYRLEPTADGTRVEHG
jgi:hypothetical protein